MLSGPAPDPTAPTQVAAALEDNVAAFLAYCADRVPGAESRATDDLAWATTGADSYFFNAVVRTRLSAADADPHIAAMLARCAARGVPLTWWIWPSTRPADLGERLVARGLSDRGEGPGMALALSALPERPPASPALSIELVADEAALAVWLWANSIGNGGAGDVIRADDLAFEAALGVGGALPYRRFLAWLGGEPVATAALFMGPMGATGAMGAMGTGVAGLYSVATVPAARRQGIGAAISQAALSAARAAGASRAVLLSSPLGHPVYHALGFREVCRVRSYVYRPPSASG